MCEIIPRLRNPVIGVKIGKGVVGGDHTPHDGEVEEGTCTEKFQGKYFLIFFRDIEWGMIDIVSLEKYCGSEENKKRVDEWKERKKNMEILVFDA